MKISGDIAEIASGFEQVADRKLNAEINVCKVASGIEINGINGKYEIKYSKKIDFFRALSIITHRIKKGEKDFHVTENAAFDTCGIMVDVSRNAVLKVETAEKLLRYMAKMGLNMLMLYSEDTYKMEKYPYFGYFRGAYEKDELKKIVAYADMFGIEVVPCIQTLAHLSRTLRWAYSASMKDTSDILLIDEDKTYEFIEEMMKTSRECFKTEKIHIGMDEAHYVGLGTYLSKHGYTNRFELLSRHLNKVTELARKYGFEPMMWSDMPIRLGSKSGEYYDLNIKMPDNISEIIPENISMVYWDYYNNFPYVYEKMIEIHKTMGRKIVFAGGIWTWSGPSVQYEKTFVTTRAALSQCIKHGVRDVFATMWGDDGAECGIFEALLGMQMYAEYNYSQEFDDARLAEMFKICTGLDMKAFLLLSVDTFNDPRCPEKNATVSKQVFYQNILEGIFDRNLAEIDLKSHYARFKKELADIPEQNELEYMFNCHRLYVDVLYEKCDIGIRLTKAYKDGDRKAMTEIKNELPGLVQSIKKYHNALADMWYMNNKPFGFSVLDARIGGVETLVGRAEERLAEYLDGKVSKLPELEEERLWYGHEDQPFVHCYHSESIMFS